VATTQLKLRFVLSYSEHVNVAGGVLVQRHRLKQYVVGSLWRILNVNQLVELVLALEDVRVALFANLAFELLPVVARNVLSVLFRVALGRNPALQAVKVDEAH